MKKPAILIVVIGAVVIPVWFIRELKAGNDGAWLVLGIIGTMGIYLFFSVVELVKDRLRARWGRVDAANTFMEQHLRQLQEVSRVQGQQLVNQQKMGRLGPAFDDDLLSYADALDGEVLELPPLDNHF